MYSLPKQESLLIFIEQSIPLPPVYAALNTEVGEKSLDRCLHLGAELGVH